jgi:Fe-S-cluster containining protein
MECKRCGTCCNDVRLAESPEMLRKAYEYWLRMPSVDPKFSEIYLIYPMLTFKYENQSEDLPYHYACKHFTRDSKGLGVCSIYEIRPRMCRDFPYYEGIELAPEEKVSPYDGCGYNKSGRKN